MLPTKTAKIPGKTAASAGVKPVDIKSLTGMFRTYPTLELILNSLGIFPEGLRFYPLTRDPEPLYKNAAFLPFTLSQIGVNFFYDLLEQEINPKAYLVIMQVDKDCEKSYFGEIETVPCGIVFEAQAELINETEKIRKVYFFNLIPFLIGKNNYHRYFEHVKHYASKVAQDQFPENRSFLVTIDLGAEPTAWNDFGLSKKLSEKYGFNGVFKILSLGKENVFSHQNPHSADFQHALCANADRFKGRRVVELGVGSGINLLYALRFGASSVWANDLSDAYVLLARWNLQYAQDTQQIEPQPDRIGIHKGADFSQAPPADLYLFNAPSIRNPGSMPKFIFPLSALGNQSNYIPEEKFIPLFAELKSRLLSSNGAAIWRILPYLKRPSYYFPEPDVKKLSEIVIFHPEQQQVRALAVARAEEFLKWHSELAHERACGNYGDIFIIRGADSSG